MAAVYHRAKCRHRARVHICSGESVDLRNYPGRLGLEQQVQRARIASGKRSDRELRNPAWRIGAGRRIAFRHAEPRKNTLSAGRERVLEYLVSAACMSHFLYKLTR